MRTWRLLLVGFGTVGRGVAERLRDCREALHALGCDLRIVAVVDPVVGSVQRPAGLDPGRLVELADAGRPLADHPGAEAAPESMEAVRRVDCDVVVELTPTNLRDGEPGLSHLRAALGAGRHVVTTNKGPIVLAYRELTGAARRRGLQLRFEGTVLSGTPALLLWETGLPAAGLREVRGILNGTCNYILTEMEAGRSYEEALAAARQAGYAEADPSADVEGWDAAAKVAILANHLLGASLSLEAIRRQGITGLTRERFQEAQAAGRRWRLVASLRQEEGGWVGRVAPEALAPTDPLSRVTGATNMLIFRTDALGEVRISGPGAGRRATGHAVLADLVAIHRAVGAGRP